MKLLVVPGRVCPCAQDRARHKRDLVYQFFFTALHILCMSEQIPCEPFSGYVSHLTPPESVLFRLLGKIHPRAPPPCTEVTLDTFRFIFRVRWRDSRGKPRAHPANLLRGFSVMPCQLGSSVMPCQPSPEADTNEATVRLSPCLPSCRLSASKRWTTGPRSLGLSGCA